MDGTTSTTTKPADDEKGASAAQGAEPQLLATAVGDTCANCGARLAGDQRYCLECGTRRGKPRYVVPTTTAAAGAPPTRGGYRPGRWGWMSSNASLILGVGVLLLAMGVGVLIGHDTAGTTSSGKAQVITVNGAASGAAAAPTTTPTAPTTAGTGSSRSKSSSTAKTKTPAVTAAAKLPPAAKKIPPKLKSKVATIGSKCPSGGKFTGTFFGASGTTNGCSK